MKTKAKNPHGFDTNGINKYVNRYVEQLGDLTGKMVLDCPAGDGRTTFRFLEQGAKVTSADLFPSFFKLPNQKCDFVDLKKGLPYQDNSFDIAICQEGIEHMQDQLFVLQEFARVLKPEGKLIITAPSISHLRSRVSFLLSESEAYKRSAANELDSVWFSEENQSELYYGHVFMLNHLKLRTLASFSGFEIDRFIKTDYGSTSLLLFPFLYPFIYLASWFPSVSYRKKLKQYDSSRVTKMMDEQFQINTSPKTLLCKHLFAELTKVRAPKENVQFLKAATRKS